MLVKLAFVMQGLKKYLEKIFCHDQQRLGGQFLDFMEDTAVMMGGIELMEVPLVSPPPPLGKTLDYTLPEKPYRPQFPPDVI